MAGPLGQRFWRVLPSPFYLGGRLTSCAATRIISRKASAVAGTAPGASCATYTMAAIDAAISTSTTQVPVVLAMSLLDDQSGGAAVSHAVAFRVASLAFHVYDIQSVNWCRTRFGL